MLQKIIDNPYWIIIIAATTLCLGSLMRVLSENTLAEYRIIFTLTTSAGMFLVLIGGCFWSLDRKIKRLEDLSLAIGDLVANFGHSHGQPDHSRQAE